MALYQKAPATINPAGAPASEPLGMQGPGAPSSPFGGGGFSGPFLSALLGSPYFSGGADEVQSPWLAFRRRFARPMPPIGPPPPAGIGDSIMGRGASVMGLGAPPQEGASLAGAPAPGGRIGQRAASTLGAIRTPQMDRARRVLTKIGGGSIPGPQEGGAPYNWGMLNQAIVNMAKAGFFGAEPPPALMEAIRSRMIGDVGAQSRAARLGLQARGDIDPSTYGFQALMSDLRGQDALSRQMGQADLAARMQQQQFLQSLFQQAIGGQQRLQRPEGSGGFDWGKLLGGVGGLIGLGGGGGGAASGYSYPEIGGGGYM